MVDQVENIEWPKVNWDRIAIYSQLVKIGEKPEEPPEDKIHELAAWPLSKKVEHLYDNLLGKLIDFAWAETKDRRQHRPLEETKDFLMVHAAFALFCVTDAVNQLHNDEMPDMPRDGMAILQKAAAEVSTDGTRPEDDECPPVVFTEEDLWKIATSVTEPEVKRLMMELFPEKDIVKPAGQQPEPPSPNEIDLPSTLVDLPNSTIKEIDGFIVLMVSGHNTQEGKSYTLTATVDTNTLQKILELTGGGHGDLPPEEAARLTDTLVLECSDPDKLKMKVTDPATGDMVPISTLTKFNFNISTKFAITPKGVAFKIGEQSVLLKPGKSTGWEQWYAPDKTLEDLVRDLKEEDKQDACLSFDDKLPESMPIPSLPQGSKLPEDTSQYTFEEMRAVSYAMADTSTLRHWTPAERDSNLSILSMLYKRPGERFEIKFDPGGLTTELRTGLQLDSTDAIEEFLQKRGFRGTLTLQMMGKAAILQTDEAITLDDFVNKLFDPRTAKDRHEARRWTWDTIRTILALRLYGARAGVYKDPETKKPIDLTFRGEPFIVLSPGARKFAMGQQPLWPDSEIPVTLGFTMGAWGKEMKKHHAILSQFGKLDQVLAISAGKPAGAWAQCILFNLNQLWREKAKDVSVTTHTRTDGNGNDRKVIATRWPNAFTRRELLCNLCPPDQAFSVMDILNSKDPSRAKRYWNAAIKILKDQGSISYYKELAPLDSKRKGWAEDWLDQPIDIRPCEDAKKDAREIKASHQKALSARKRKPKDNGKR